MSKKDWIPVEIDKKKDPEGLGIAYVRDTDVGHKECYVGGIKEINKKILFHGKGILAVYEANPDHMKEIHEKIDPWSRHLLKYQKNFILPEIEGYYLGRKFKGGWKDGLLEGLGEYIEYHQPEFFVNKDGSPMISEKYIGLFKKGKKEGIFKNFFGNDGVDDPGVFYEEYKNDEFVKKVEDLKIIPENLKKIKWVNE